LGEPSERIPATDFETTPDAFRYVHTESVTDLEARADELEQLLEEGLTESLAKLLKQV
jgi:hypothetical protein